MKFPIARINAKVGGLLACLPSIGGFAMYDFFNILKISKNAKKALFFFRFSAFCVFKRILDRNKERNRYNIIITLLLI